MQRELKLAVILALTVGFSVDDVLHALQDGEFTLNIDTSLARTT